MTQPLKLRARDGEDMQVISAMMQDAIAPVCDMAYRAADGSFVMVVQRLRREAGKADERICCALTISGVTAAHTHGIDLRAQDRILELLALMLDAQDGRPSLNLIFAGGAQIRLALGAWGAVVEDFGESWPALCNPCHDEAVGTS
ncbi:MAG: DUF2948 family protein [Alphaproteobacteria bacterium]|nr:DUF2948 family protein [Alphaproteobacteria bacterium]